MTPDEILQAAVDRKTPAERAAYLDGACGADAALRAHIDSLLRAHDAAGSFLERPLVEAPPTADLPPDPPAGPAGTRIGPYKLLQKLGEGGMGTVYMAEQTEPVRRTVALKLIKPGMDSAQVIARFEAERQALALMDHPNIAKVLDAGTTGESEPRPSGSGPGPLPDGRGSGRPYFVMELVKGIPITRFCDDHHLTPRERLELFVPVCQAVQHAHQKGIIHRDLKPSNVLVALYDDRPVPKVIDFGVAKAAGERLTERTMFTEFGAIVGTLEYMSPEQARLNALDIDTRTDVYALGVLLYELLTGTTPFDRKRLRSAALDELLRIIREEEPPKPSTRLSGSAELPSIAANRRTEPQKLGRLVRGELDWIVMRALEKDRSRRYETANGFARDIQRYLADEPVEACPPSAGYRLRKLTRRYRGALAAAAVVLVVLAGATVVSAWQAVRAERARRAEAEQRAEAERQRDDAREQRRRTRAALDDMLSDESLAFLTTQQELLPQQKAFLERALKYYQEFAALADTEEQGRALVARAQLRVGHIYSTLGKRSEAEAAHRVALVAYEKLAADFPGAPEYRRDLALSHHNLGCLLLEDRSRRPEAEAPLRAALALREKLVAEFPAVPEYRNSLAHTHNFLGLVLSHTRKLAEAEPAHRAAVALSAKLVAEFPDVPKYRSNLARYYNGLGILLSTQRRLPEAEAAFQAARALNEKLVADFPTEPAHRFELATVLGTLSGFLIARSRTEAETVSRAAVNHWEKLVAEFPAVPKYRSRLASNYNTLGLRLRVWNKPAESEAAHRAAVVHAEKLVADFPAIPEHRFVLANNQNGLGLILRAREKPAEAEAAFRKARAINERLIAEFPTVPIYRDELGRNLFGLGNLLRDLGRGPEAEAAFRARQEVYAKLAADFPAISGYRAGLASSYVNFGSFLHRRGQTAAALDWYAKAIPLLEALVAEDAGQATRRNSLRDAHAARAEALRHLARPAEAVAEFDRALALDDGSQRPALGLGRALALAIQTGDFARAVAEAEELARSDKVAGDVLTAAAGVYAVASAAVTEDAAQRESYAAQAVALLRRAQAADYFQGGRHVEDLKADPDFSALRGREHFQALLKELESKK